MMLFYPFYAITALKGIVQLAGIIVSFQKVRVDFSMIIYKKSAIPVLDFIERGW